jgi:phage FluMu protein Com
MFKKLRCKHDLHLTSKFTRGGFSYVATFCPKCHKRKEFSIVQWEIYLAEKALKEAYKNEQQG